MGHFVGKDLYRQLGRKIDGLTTRAPWNESLYAILKELYSPREAELVVRMPYGVATAEGIATISGFEPAEVQCLLDGLCEKGLVLDMWDGRQYRYTVSPLIIGIFEFTMMRTRGELNVKEWAKLFHDYLQGDSSFCEANFGRGEQISPLRALAHEEAICEEDYVEVLDYDRAGAIVDRAKTIAVGICSCRHEKLHVGAKQCDVPLRTCSSFDGAAQTLIRHGMAEEISREEMRERLADSRDRGLVLCADNVRRGVSFICHCCGCCCNVLLGLSRFGYPNVVVSSNYLPVVDARACLECGECVAACPVQAIRDPEGGGRPVVDERLCLGCGVCALACSSDSLKLERREQRMFCPEDTFERVILQTLERGTLQNLIFSNPGSGSQGFLRAFVGGVLKLPPIRRALLSDLLRSRFIQALRP